MREGIGVSLDKQSLCVTKRCYDPRISAIVLKALVDSRLGTIGKKFMGKSPKVEHRHSLTHRIPSTRCFLSQAWISNKLHHLRVPLIEHPNCSLGASNKSSKLHKIRMVSH